MYYVNVYLTVGTHRQGEGQNELLVVPVQAPVLGTFSKAETYHSLFSPYS